MIYRLAKTPEEDCMKFLDYVAKITKFHLYYYSNDLKKVEKTFLEVKMEKKICKLYIFFGCL